MDLLLLGAMMIANVQVTGYRSIPAATDTSPTITSIGERTNHAVVAVSQDLLRSGALQYGDTIYIEGLGLRVVMDCMNARHKNRVDVWCATLDEERAIHKKFKGKTLKIYKILIKEGSTCTSKKRNTSATGKVHAITH